LFWDIVPLCLKLRRFRGYFYFEDFLGAKKKAANWTLDDLSVVMTCAAVAILHPVLIPESHEISEASPGLKHARVGGGRHGGVAILMLRNNGVHICSNRASIQFLDLPSPSVTISLLSSFHSLDSNSRRRHHVPFIILHVQFIRTTENEGQGCMVSRV